MSAEFKKQAVDHIIQGLRDTEVFKFIQVCGELFSVPLWSSLFVENFLKIYLWVQ